MSSQYEQLPVFLCKPPYCLIDVCSNVKPGKMHCYIQNLCFISSYESRAPGLKALLMLFNVKNFSSILDWLCNRNSNSLEKIIILLQEKKRKKNYVIRISLKSNPEEDFFLFLKKYNSSIHAWSQLLANISDCSF